MMFPSLTEADLAPYRELYPDAFSPAGLALDCGGFIVRTADATVLVDTGFGPGPHAMLGGAKGNMAADIQANGVPLESVDAVVHTHLHVDHVGWNLTDGKPTFPNATYYGPQADYDLFAPNLAANAHMSQVIPLKEMGKLELYAGAVQITPEVSTMATPGHTPGHHSVLVKSGDDSVIVTGDVAHHPFQVDRPDWSDTFDLDKTQADETRARLMEQLEKDGALAAFCHFQGDGIGRIVRKNGRRVFQAL
jgi:glyoxylase-like metal-dependent hydrolase (beta-lactamase superfamily II)